MFLLTNLSQPVPEGSLHLIVPATSSNPDLCKLLLSASILGYPSPILINWGAEENKDPYVQHLAKVWTILEYLDLLLEHGKGDDLVLIVDGFDVHFQLPPEVIISRYYQENARANKRVEELWGADVANEHNMKQTVIFGHDKICWPEDPKRPACWAVPEASDPKYAFGPYTDENASVNRPRWLNSGTVIGPVSDTRDIFRATLDLIHNEHTTDSDQFYFANVFGTQEFVRQTKRPDEPLKEVKKEDVTWPTIAPDQRTEYNLGLDYEAVLFQTMAFFREYIAWMTFDLKKPKAETWTKDKAQQRISHDDFYRSRYLPDDIRAARGPFDALKTDRNLPASSLDFAEQMKDRKLQKIPVQISWDSLRLGANVISNQVFPLLHFTGDKGFRAVWWPRLWFYPWAEELLKAGVKRRAQEEAKYGKALITRREIGNRTWWHGEVVGPDAPAEVNWGFKGGAFSGNGTFLGWDELCVMHEKLLYRPPPKAESKTESKADPKAESKPDPKAESKPDTKPPETKPQ